jgi:hypothetical protein
MSALYRILKRLAAVLLIVEIIGRRQNLTTLAKYFHRFDLPAWLDGRSTVVEDAPSVERCGADAAHNVLVGPAVLDGLALAWIVKLAREAAARSPVGYLVHPVTRAARAA